MILSWSLVQFSDLWKMNCYTFIILLILHFFFMDNSSVFMSVIVYPSRWSSVWLGTTTDLPSILLLLLTATTLLLYHHLSPIMMMMIGPMTRLKVNSDRNEGKEFFNLFVSRWIRVTLAGTVFYRLSKCDDNEPEKFNAPNSPFFCLIRQYAATHSAAVPLTVLQYIVALRLLLVQVHFNIIRKKVYFGPENIQGLQPLITEYGTSLVVCSR